MNERSRTRCLPVLAFAILFVLVAFSGVAGVRHGSFGTASVDRSALPTASPSLSFLSPSAHGHGGGGGGGCPSSLPIPNGIAYTPAMVAGAYAYSSADGAGTTIAIIDAYGSGTLSSDLSCFDQTFSLPAPPSLSIVQPFGRVHGSSSGWAIETSLDTEWAHAMAPAAKLLVIETPSASLSSLINQAVPYAVQHGASVISMSWGAAESQLGCSTEATESAYFSQAATAGTILVAASGDNGANDGTGAPTVDYPSADPSVVGAGGTSLTLTGSGAYGGETVWNDASGATGGGVSACFSEPSYQSSAGIQVTTSSGAGTPSGRAVPDVAYDASPYTGFWVMDGGAWYQVGGTSAAAPQWAAIFADALSTTISNLNGNSVHSLLYSIASSNYHDVTSGNNNYEYASSGYDACTGIGSPVEQSLVSSL